MNDPNEADRVRRRVVLLAALLGASGVAAGAFGAHGLADRVDPAQLQWWKTGAQYQLVHAVAVLGLAGLPIGGRWRARAAMAFGFGVFIFAGTLYAMALGAPRWFGAITPIGGASLIVGWMLAGAGAWSARE